MSIINWGGKPVPVTRLCGWDWVPLDIAQARIAALEAALTAELEAELMHEREAIDESAKTISRQIDEIKRQLHDNVGLAKELVRERSHSADLSMDLKCAEAERDELRKQNAQLIAAIKEAPHGAGCLFGLKATASMFYHCNCWKRTALGDK